MPHITYTDSVILAVAIDIDLEDQEYESPIKKNIEDNKSTDIAETENIHPNTPPCASPFTDTLEQTTPEVVDGNISSINEARMLVTPMIGKWATLVKKSDLYEPILKRCGISLIKRKVLNTYSIEIDNRFDEKCQNTFIITAYMPMNVQKKFILKLDGTPVTVIDQDAGNWVSVSSIVTNDEGVRVVQNIRTGKSGEIVEVRRVIADKEYGELLHILLKMTTPKDKTPIIVNRYCKRIS
eukprot:GHVR01054012.1.p1 GENE.GHVR01054012.1~~GHVR01054012.1.p1  ORF type:complete len:239 (+),score=53.09 GHVR01054012.1:314-1030(+)